jgi:hypothetical protein
MSASRGPLTVELHGDKAAGRVALIDPEDLSLVGGYRWFVWEYPERSWGPYPVTHIGRGRGVPTRLMHQVLTGFQLCDHVNRDGLDNQRHNLREATRQQNLYNQSGRKNSTSQYKGVSRKRNRWRARITIDGKQFQLGSFTDEVDAAIAYDLAAQAAFGEYAFVNLPEIA